MKIVVVLGTRPEGIKMAPVIQRLRERGPSIETLVCSTGQHREMLDQALDLFGITPDYDLDLMQQDQTPSQVAANVLTALDPLLVRLQPDWLLVQGDTTTVVAAALAAHYRKVRVGHVEAGLRTHDRLNPFPEEINRVLTDHISEMHFAPTVTARNALLCEGIQPDSIHITGNTVTDALLWVVKRPLPPQHLSQYGRLETVLADASNPLVLVTAHRRENHGRPIRQICYALRKLVETRPGLRIIYPVHRNPNIWQPVHELLDNIPGVTLLQPVDYLTLAHLMMCSQLILTDSGGIQEEAPTLGVPVLVMRETTERPEAIQARVARLVGTDPDCIISEALRLIDDDSAHAAMSRPENPYGDGRAAERIVDVLLHGTCQPFVQEQSALLQHDTASE
jgi:UDP-N-acetylglucosamine 2-epimerase